MESYFQLRDTPIDEEMSYDEPEPYEGHFSFSSCQSHQMGIQGPNITYVPIHGVFQLFYCTIDPYETM
jgi:hypothetical protein